MRSSIGRSRVRNRGAALPLDPLVSYPASMIERNRRIEDLARKFVEDLTQIAREQVLEMLGGGITPSRLGTTRDGTKRPAALLDKLEQRFLAFVRTNPGLRIEQINAALGTTTKELALPIRKLVGTSALKREGARRATRYFPADATTRSAPTARGKARQAKRSTKRRR